MSLGRACIDSGADIVWGNHPHVLQGGELYNGKPILYSMGNLISSKEGSTGVVKLTYDAGKFVSAIFLPLRISAGRVGAGQRPARAGRGQDLQDPMRVASKAISLEKLDLAGLV